MLPRAHRSPEEGFLEASRHSQLRHAPHVHKSFFHIEFSVKREPPFETGEEHDELVTDRTRGDLLLVRHNTRLVVDVTVTRPTAKTELRLRRGVPAAAPEKRKHKSYDDACGRDGATMVPFAVESYGAKGKQAQKLLLKLADASEELSAEAFLRHASAVVSVALQCRYQASIAHAVQQSSGHLAFVIVVKMHVIG